MTQTTIQRRLITVREAAQLAGLSEQTLRRLIRSAGAGHDQALARAVLELPGHARRIRRAAFERWLSGTDTTDTHEED